MEKFLSILVLIGCFGMMAIGLILARKTLKKGCSLGPDCHCKNDPPKSSDDCEHKA
ncbi:MAG: hypothetical protein Q8Q08_05965 [Candidatus Omnitrophota bacterium]|nr:hypothetical protein [Candidatus Omnitrophota bacterium]